MRASRNSPALESSLKLVESAEIQIWPSGRIGRNDELARRLLKEHIQHATLFFDFEAVFVLIFALDQMALEQLQGCVGSAAKLVFILHGPSVATQFTVHSSQLRTTGAKSEL